MEHKDLGRVMRVIASAPPKEDYLAHSKGAWKKHKYTKKVWKNGKWVYYYYDRSYKDEDGNQWDVYVDPETGEGQFVNRGFKYDPKRYSLQDMGRDIDKSLQKQNESLITPMEEDDKERYENLKSKGLQAIEDFFGRKKKHYATKKGG